MRTAPLSLLIAGALALPSAAQGLGQPTGFQIDATAKAGAAFNGMLGVARLPDGRTIVSGRRDATTNPHKLFVFDAAGNLTTNINQPAGTATSSWGVRDLAYDVATQRLYGGCEGNQLFFYDLTTSTWSAAVLVPALAIPRALAFDNATGRLWSANFGSSLFEIDPNSGATIATYPLSNLVLGGAPSPSGIYGAAYDPVRKTVWWFSQNGSTRPATANGAGVVGIEMWTYDGCSGSGIKKGFATGQVWVGDPSVPPSTGNPPGGIAGGIEFGVKNGKPVLVYLTQSNSDTVVELHGRLNYGTDCTGLMNSSGNACYDGNLNFSIDVVGVPSAGSGALLFSTSASPVPGGLPIPGIGLCNLQVDPTQIFFTTSPVTLTPDGQCFKGQFPFGIPAGLAPGFTFYAQWVLLKAVPALPLGLSDGGAFYIAK